MNKSNQSNSENKSINSILQEIEQTAKDNHRCIYRGEANKCFEQVCSGLYRVYGERVLPSEIWTTLQTKILVYSQSH